MKPAAPRPGLAVAWLALGAGAGLALAAAALIGSGGFAAPPQDTGAVAWVDGRPIARETFARFAAASARERGRLVLDAAAERELLERLVDEELLLDHGLALGLARREPAARRAIVAAAVDALTADEALSVADERAALEAFYAETGRDFAGPPRLEVEAALVAVAAGATAAVEDEAHAEASALAERARAGAPLPAASPPLPRGPQPLAALRERLGDAPAEAAESTPPGGVAGPVRGAGGFWVLRVLAKAEAPVPPLDEVFESVRAAFWQGRHEAVLRERLAALRARADVRFATR